MHSLIPYVSPAMAHLLILAIAAMIPNGEEARCSLQKFDANLEKILGLFGDNYIDAAEAFTESLGD